MDGHVILNTQGVLDSAVVPAKGIRTGCPDAPSDGFVSHGVSRSTIILRMAVRDHGRRFISGWLMLIIRMCCGDYPDVYALPASFALPWIGEAETSFCFGFVVRNGSKKDCFICRVSEAGEKAIDKLNAKEFRERFCIPTIIDLVNEEAAMPTEKGEKTLPLHKGTIQRGAPVPSAGVVQGIPPLLSDSTHLHSSQPCPGADGMQHHQHAVQPRPYATGKLPDSTKGGAKGLVASGVDGRGYRSMSRPFSPNYTLKIPGLELRGHLVDWVEKASFACEYVINILPRKLAKDEIVPGEHYTVKELPLYQEAKEADAERRRKLLEDRDQKKMKALSGRLPDRSGVRTLLQRKLPGKRGSCNDRGASKRCSALYLKRPRTHVGVESIRSFLGLGARLANVAEEAASINRPGNLNPDADAAETAPLEEAGAESQSQPSDDPDRLAIVLVKGPPQEAAFDARSTSGLFGGFKSGSKRLKLAALLPMTLIMDGGEVEMALRPQPPRQ
ncbi:hypothetical protein CK203_008918 [Vitis vinifera]|uniref:Uncharacterized protein n=1 Tax=Vitis vinifera TaxID=29760 RepID=A0A438KDR7_VITVI|nr:hypothetical protein CK203_008918 [Vitis vinifera]